MSEHEDWLSNKYNNSPLSIEQKQIRVRRVVSIILDKINQLGIETFDGFDAVRSGATMAEINVWLGKSNRWVGSKVTDRSQPMYVEVISFFMSALQHSGMSANFASASLILLAIVSNMLDDGRMDMNFTNNEEYYAVTKRRVGYEIVWNIFEDT